MRKRRLLSQFAIIVSILSVLVMLVLPEQVQAEQKQRIIRIAHNQSSNHPTHIGMEAFEKYIEQELGDKYDVQIYPSELLGTQTNMVQLTQTGAIEITVASNSILETFNQQFQIFNLPYLFETPEIYHAVMNDPEIVGPIFNGTEESGFITKAWLDAGTRNFYVTKGPIEKPSDLSGLKIRVQQSPTNVRMMELLGGSATPMGFGDVYTAIQSGVIDGAENNELALTENGHGDIVKNYSYTLHQMIPDEVIVNSRFLDELPAEDKKIFDHGFQIMQDTQHQAWQEKVEEAKEKAEKDMGVKFNYPDTAPFREAVMPLHKEVLEANPSLEKIYKQIEEKAKTVKAEDKEAQADAKN
ncbi:TRAP transporter substrate-binding protein [Aerococcus sp. UMB7834]|uniref:TRAP transporter substrate-binding protein n=1 Tax=Aerococcus sp. UMB7834 TaxID=3046342 RepID=UPI00254E0F61|nr:TRAP transporter substrate-binding protein [Aerococcus sp. UMB7834]MDK6805728.1 TRAP transporter substrate-binding protein [Aerococcus sp. UMB7834]